MIGRMLRRLFGSKQAVESADAAAYQDSLPGGESRQSLSSLDPVRRWDSAQTHRLNQAHWSAAVIGQHINDDLCSHLRTLQARCSYEASSNPWVEGVIKTHSIDLVTPSGPTLVVESSNDRFNRTFRDAWNEWWASPEIAGELSGVDLLRRWNAAQWTKGTILGQFVTDPTVTSSSLVSLRIRDIDPARLDSPPGLLRRSDIAFGVQRDVRTGRPTKFYVRRYDGRTNTDLTWKYDDILAEDAVFAFESIEADQAVGYPRLASCLEEISQLRDYDTEVMDAARQFANNAIAFYTEQPEFVTRFGKALPTGTVEMKRGTGKYLAPGWKPQALNSTQPAANYKEFRFEKLRSLGRPVAMPLLLILLSAEESNFSQSRIDVNVFYERGLKAQRHWIESHVLRSILARFAQEMQLAQRRGQFILPPRPDDLRVSWHWEEMPQADELKHLQAMKLKRELGTSTWSHDLAAAGHDRDAMKQTIARDRDDLEELGLTPTGSEPSPATDSTPVGQTDTSTNTQDQEA